MDGEVDDMEPQQTSPSNFLGAFFGSFVAYKDYPKFAQRSWGSIALHFLVLVTLVCSLYAGLASRWLQVHVEPHLQSTAAQVPHIVVKDGVASVDIEQPYVLEIEKQPVFVIDTTADPQVHLDKYPAIVVLSADRFTTKDNDKKIESYELAGNFEVSAGKIQEWIAIASSWTLPILFLFTAGWQLCWKAVQVLLVATIVTLVHQSRPSFATHLKLATHALGPAMAWGLLVFLARTTGVFVPFAGLVFWGILFGITYKTAASIKNSPLHH